MECNIKNYKNQQKKTTGINRWFFSYFNVTAGDSLPTSLVGQPPTLVVEAHIVGDKVLGLFSLHLKQCHLVTIGKLEAVDHLLDSFWRNVIVLQENALKVQNLDI
jgi:hypothetical protein